MKVVKIIGCVLAVIAAVVFGVEIADTKTGHKISGWVDALKEKAGLKKNSNEEGAGSTPGTASSTPGTTAAPSSTDTSRPGAGTPSDSRR